MRDNLLFSTAFDLKLPNMKLDQHETTFEAHHLRSKQPTLSLALEMAYVKA